MKKSKGSMGTATARKDETFELLTKIQAIYVSDKRSNAVGDLEVWIAHKVREYNYRVTEEMVLNMISNYEKGPANKASIDTPKEPQSEISTSTPGFDEVLKDYLFACLDREKIMQFEFAAAAAIRVEYLSQMKRKETMGEVPARVWKLLADFRESGKSLREYFKIVNVDRATPKPQKPAKKAKIKPISDKNTNVVKDLPARKVKKAANKEKSPLLPIFTPESKKFMATVLNDAIAFAKITKAEAAKILDVKAPYLSMLSSDCKKTVPNIVWLRINDWINSNVPLLEYKKNELSNQETQDAPINTEPDNDIMGKENPNSERLLDLYHQYLADHQDGFVSNIHQWCQLQSQETGIPEDHIFEFINDQTNELILKVEPAVLSDDEKFEKDLAAIYDMFERDRANGVIKDVCDWISKRSNENRIPYYSIYSYIYQRNPCELPTKKASQEGDKDKNDKIEFLKGFIASWVSEGSFKDNVLYIIREEDKKKEEIQANRKGLYPHIFWLEDRVREIDRAINNLSDKKDPIITILNNEKRWLLKRISRVRPFNKIFQSVLSKIHF